MVLDTAKHYPVLLSEVISVITPQRGGTFIDCTFGQGGYTKEILKYKNTKVIGLDRDINSEVVGKKIQENFPNKTSFPSAGFDGMFKARISETIAIQDPAKKTSEGE